MINHQFVAFYFNKSIQLAFLVSSIEKSRTEINKLAMNAKCNSIMSTVILLQRECTRFINIFICERDD